MVALVGRNFGPNNKFIQELKFGPTGEEFTLISQEAGIQQCNLTAPHTRIECMIPPGVGTGHTWSMRVAGIPLASRPPPPLINYSAPVIEAISPQVGVTTGAYTMSISGSNFGPAGDFSLMFWDYRIEWDEITYTSDGEISIEVPEGQNGPHNVFIVQETDVCIDSCTQTSNYLNFTYQPPVIDRVIVEVVGNESDYRLIKLYGPSLATDYLNGGSYGAASEFEWVLGSGEIIAFENKALIVEKNATLPPLDQLEELSTECVIDPRFESVYGHNKIACVSSLTEGTIFVNVGGVLSNLVEFSDISPYVNSIEVGSLVGGDRPTSGGFSLTIKGRYFGDSKDGVEVLLLLDEFDTTGTPFMNYAKCKISSLDVPEDIINEDATIMCTVPPGMRNVET